MHGRIKRALGAMAAAGLALTAVGGLSLSVGAGAAQAAAAQLTFALTDSNQGGAPQYQFQYGLSGRTAVSGDWNGDGTDGVGVLTPTGSGWRWQLINSTSGGSPSHDFTWGSASCKGITGDWDGNKTATIGIACPGPDSNPVWTWSLRNSNSAGGVDISFSYGSTDCTPVTGDWNNDRKTTIGVVCDDGAASIWKLRDVNAAGAPNAQFSWGASQCEPLTGDWNNDGSTTPGQACVVSGSSSWSITESNFNSASGGTTFSYGNSAWTVALTGDSNGDGSTSVGVVTAPPAPVSDDLVTLPNHPDVPVALRGRQINAPTPALASGIQAGLNYLGYPYVWGGGTAGGGPDEGCDRGDQNYPHNSCMGIVGFDCSGLTAYVLKQANFTIPTYSSGQRNGGDPIGNANGAPGDIVGYPGHVAVYLGYIDGVEYQLAAPTYGKTVRVEAIHRSDRDTYLHRWWR